MVVMFLRYLLAGVFGGRLQFPTNIHLRIYTMLCRRPLILTMMNICDFISISSNTYPALICFSNLWHNIKDIHPNKILDIEVQEQLKLKFNKLFPSVRALYSTTPEVANRYIEMLESVTPDITSCAQEAIDLNFTNSLD